MKYFLTSTLTIFFCLLSFLGVAFGLPPQIADLLPRPKHHLPLPHPANIYRFTFPSGEKDSVIKNDFLCNDDTIGGCDQTAPTLTAGADGSFVVAWYEFRDGDADIWFQRFDSAGQPIGVNERVNTDISIGWQGDPASAIGPEGRFIFTWEDRREIGNSDLFAQWFDANGTRVGDNFRVSDSGVPGDQSISAVHISSDGTTLIAWDDRRYGLTGDIFAQFLNPDGSPRGSNFRVNDDPIGQANQYEPDVGGDDSGRFVVVWMDGRGTNSWDWNIFLQRFKSDGTRLGNNIPVTPDESTQWAPRVSVGASGEFVVCWDDRRQGQWDIYAQIYSSSGAPVGGNFRVNQDGGNADQYGGALAINRFGELIIVWTDLREGNEDIYAQRFDINGNRLGPEFKVNDDRGTAPQHSATVAAAPGGGYWIAWADAREGNLDIYCQRVARDGTPLGANFKVNDDIASSHQRTSSIGMERNGNLCIAWDDARQGASDIYGAVFDSLGQEIGANFRVNDDPLGGAHYYPSVAGGKDRFLITWTDERGGFDIYGQFLTRAGQRIGNNFRINSDVGDNSQWYPFCALDSLNRAVVVWTDYREGGARVYARVYDENGAPIGAEFPVSDVSAQGEYASVARNSAGYWVTAWMDARDGDYNIYCQIFRPDGSRIGPNIRVNTDLDKVYQGFPACAISDAGNIAIAWEDMRNKFYNVYLQWFDSTGNRLAENELVPDEPHYDCYSPSCAFDPSGRLVVTFNDEREGYGNPQIYCQRFRPDRTRISTNQKINQPNLFPKNSHWTVGQSVAVNSGRIAFTWTDNRRHRGWDIYAKITDWNLIALEETMRDEALIPNPPNHLITPLIVSRGGRLKVKGGITVKIYDVSGREIKSHPRSSAEREIELQSLVPGAYFVIVSQGPLRKVSKLIIE